MLRIDLSRKDFHFWIYYFGLCLLAVSLPTSRFMITVSVVLLAANWIAEGNFRSRFAIFYSQKPAVAITMLFALALVGVMWTENPIVSLRSSLHHKLPTLLIPLIIVTSSTPSVKQIRYLLSLFIASVLAVTLIGLAVKLLANPADFRDASPFIPATNFSMMLILAAFQLPILIRQMYAEKTIFYYSLGVSLWFILYLFFLRSFSGIASLAVVLTFSLIMTIYYHKSRLLKIFFGFFLLIFFFTGIWLLAYMYRLTHTEVEVNLSTLPTHTVSGNPYVQDTLQFLRENGHLVYINISDYELEQHWKSRSKLDYNGKDLRGEDLKHTLYRYLSSKGLNKDKEGLSELTHKDIEAVERGYTNHFYTKWPGIIIRTHVLMTGIYMYNKSPEKNPNWSSFTERIELWRASWVAFKAKPFLGWGTGEIEKGVNFGLKENDSLLVNSNMRSHNQYFSLIIAWGLIGFLAFVFLYSAFVYKSGVTGIFVFNVFLITAAVNGLVNDPLEGQVGQSLFIFFSVFYYYLYPKIKTKGIFTK
jgi:hypothetical protein